MRLHRKFIFRQTASEIQASFLSNFGINSIGFWDFSKFLLLRGICVKSKSFRFRVNLILMNFFCYHKISQTNLPLLIF
jgi:hypothetical protein